MDNQNLAAVDLNLLVAFEALLIERNVSRAARRLGVAQPTMSNALNRLRTSLGDELFVRTPEEMRPTPRALDLAEPVREALQQIRSMLKPPATFDPVSAQHRFVIGASDNVDFALAPGLVSVRRAAPGITIEIPSVPHQTAIAMLDDGSLDLAVGLFRAVPKRMDCVTLYWERCVCVARRGYPDPPTPLTLRQFVELPHLVVSRDTSQAVDKALMARGLKRRIAVTVPNFAVVPYILESSDLLAVVGERIAKRFASLGEVSCHQVPLDLEPWSISAVWVRQRRADPAVAWLRAMLQQTAAIL